MYNQMESIYFMHCFDTGYPTQKLEDNVFKTRHGESLHGDCEGKFDFLLHD